MEEQENVTEDDKDNIIVQGTEPEKPKSIKKNYIFSLIARIVALLVPLIITPYVSRILEPDGVGVCSYVASIVSYFVLFANLGIETFALREISINRDNKDYIKKFAVEVTIMKAILTAACLIVYYVLFICVLDVADRLLYIIYSITLIAVAFNFNWFFQGIEKFNIIAVASVFSKIAYIVCIVLFVKQKEDLNYYAAIVVSMTLAEYLITIPFIFFNIKGKISGKVNPFRHFKSCVIYFLPTVAVEIYTVVDKTMIGLITGSSFENGYYEYAEKLVKMPLAAITAVNLIMQSRMALYFSRGQFPEAESLANKSCRFCAMLSVPMAFGMVAIARTAIPLYLGEGYEKCVILVYILAWLVPIITISDFYGSNYYTPIGKRKISALFLGIGAVINVILNSFMIYLWQSLGAAIASLVAELVISILYMVYARSFFKIKQLLKNSFKYILASVVMGAVTFTLNYFLPPNVWYLILEIVVGVVVYVLMLFALRDSYFIDNLKSLIKK